MKTCFIFLNINCPILYTYPVIHNHASVAWLTYLNFLQLIILQTSTGVAKNTSSKLFIILFNFNLLN